MQEPLLFSIATDENPFLMYQPSLWKDMTAHEIHCDIKSMLQCHYPKNFSNSTIKLQMLITLKQCTICKIKGKLMISTFKFFIIDNKIGLKVLAGEAL